MQVLSPNNLTLFADDLNIIPNASGGDWKQSNEAVIKVDTSEPTNTLFDGTSGRPTSLAVPVNLKKRLISFNWRQKFSVRPNPSNPMPQDAGMVEFGTGRRLVFWTQRGIEVYIGQSAAINVGNRTHYVNFDSAIINPQSQAFSHTSGIVKAGLVGKKIKITAKLFEADEAFPRETLESVIASFKLDQNVNFRFTGETPLPIRVRYLNNSLRIDIAGGFPDSNEHIELDFAVEETTPISYPAIQNQYYSLVGADSLRQDIVDIFSQGHHNSAVFAIDERV